MSTISINIEATLDAARELFSLADFIEEHLNRVRQVTDSMYAAGNTGRYMQAFEQDNNYFQQRGRALQQRIAELARDLQNTAAAFGEADATSAGYFGHTGAGVHSGAGSQAASGEASAPPPSPSPPAASNTVPPSGRTGADLNHTLDSLDVDHNYLRKGNNTYCNIFARDAVNKLVGREILPQYRQNAHGDIVDWLDANEMIRWLDGSYQHPGYQGPTGPDIGWKQLSPQQAVQYANAGHPVIVGWENPGGIGHMAVLRAGNTPDMDVYSLRIAQAGGHNFSDGAIRDGFGSRGPLRFFAYDPQT